MRRKRGGFVLDEADNAPVTTNSPLAGLAAMLMSEGEIVRNESLAEYTRIVVRMSSGRTVEVLIHYDEAVAEGVAGGEADEAIPEDKEGGSSRES
jgi:hypothetical protein